MTAPLEDFADTVRQILARDGETIEAIWSIGPHLQGLATDPDIDALLRDAEPRTPLYRDRDGAFVLDQITPEGPAGRLLQQPRVARHRTASERLDDTRGIPEAVEKPRGLPEKRGVLLEVDADPAEQDTSATHVRLVGARRRVDGHERDVVAARNQLRRQRIVADATAAVHPCGPGRDEKDFHHLDSPSCQGGVAQPLLFFAEGKLDKQRSALKCPRTKQKFYDVAFVRLQPVQLRGRD